MTSNFASIVKTAQGETKVFAGVVSRFIVAHPRVAATLALVAGIILGRVF
jgi:hypothetical protein